MYLLIHLSHLTSHFATVVCVCVCVCVWELVGEHKGVGIYKLFVNLLIEVVSSTVLFNFSAFTGVFACVITNFLHHL